MLVAVAWEGHGWPPEPVTIAEARDGLAATRPLEYAQNRENTAAPQYQEDTGSSSASQTSARKKMQSKKSHHATTKKKRSSQSGVGR